MTSAYDCSFYIQKALSAKHIGVKQPGGQADLLFHCDLDSAAEIIECELLLFEPARVRYRWKADSWKEALERFDKELNPLIPKGIPPPSRIRRKAKPT